LPHFLDTNILLYSISRNPADRLKRERAIAPLSHETALGLLTAWTRFKVQEITLSILNSALEIKAAHRFSYWDSAIIAAARALGCRELYSEDMSHGREVEGITIINPFR